MGKRKRSELSDSESEDSEEDMDGNEISKMNLNRDQLQYLAMVKSDGTKGQLEMLKNSDMQNKILSQRGVQKERR